MLKEFLKKYLDAFFKVFEDDLKSISDLRSLTMTEKEHNRKCYLDNISYCDDFMPNFFE